MTEGNRWLLPDGIEELLPEQAAAVEQLRRSLLDLYYSWGYRLVMPPFIEFIESLLTGVGSELDLQTFKLTDQLSGRLMGVRADMTPQVARMDAHSLGEEGISRLCYNGSVLHAQAANIVASRSPLQIGAELYGYAGAEADVEIISLMLETLKLAGIQKPKLDLGHVGLFRAMVDAAGLDAEQQEQLYRLLRNKSCADIDAFVLDAVDDKQLSDGLRQLTNLHGDASVLAEARQCFSGFADELLACIDTLEFVANKVRAAYPDVELYFDLGELRGYQYHTGLVYAAYAPGFGQSIAKGGRYDDIGEVFGRARPATGFSADAKVLMQGVKAGSSKTMNRIYAPADEDSALQVAIAELRGAGEAVVELLPDETCPEGVRRLVLDKGQWQVS